MKKDESSEDFSVKNPELIGGFGERCNSNTQWHLQNLIYDSKSVSCSVTTAFLPYYLIYEDEDS